MYMKGERFLYIPNPLRLPTHRPHLGSTLQLRHFLQILMINVFQSHRHWAPPPCGDVAPAYFHFRVCCIHFTKNTHLRFYFVRNCLCNFHVFASYLLFQFRFHVCFIMLHCTSPWNINHHCRIYIYIYKIIVHITIFRKKALKLKDLHLQQHDYNNDATNERFKTSQKYS